MSMAHRNLSRCVLLKIFSIGTSNFLHLLRKLEEIEFQKSYERELRAAKHLPCHGNTGIEIVQLGRAQGNCLVLVLVSLLQFELLQLLSEALKLFLLLVFGDLVANVALLEVLWK